jgi:pantoate--beta-alanine ligase
MTVVITAVDDLRRVPRPAATGVVMTMGALHEGHIELMRAARELIGSDGLLIVTDFVNPTQFAVDEDLSRYPRTLTDDVAACERAGVDVVFAPSVAEVYGNERGFLRGSITIDPGPLGEILEGAARPGHFRGVLTVVAKLLSMTAPDVAVFGEKDYQQLVLIRRMVTDLNLPVHVVGVPTVREPDGVALSSRNRYLTEQERTVAARLPRALSAAAGAASAGRGAAIAAGRAVLAVEPALVAEYFAVRDPLLREAPAHGEARILVAARVGTTRLIDNAACWLGES